MVNVKSMVAGSLVALVLPFVAPAALADGGHTKIDGTRFTMEVPKCWNPGYKDLEALFMIFFKDPKSGMVLEGVAPRGAQPATFGLKEFTKARVGGEDKRYAGKGHKVAKEGKLTIGGAEGVYLLTTWKDGGKDMEKHTALLLQDGHRYLVVMAGEKGKVDKKIFDHAVKTFSLVKTK